MKLTLTAIGYLGHSCTVRDVQGKKAITFSLACTKKYKDKAGVQQQKTTWLECTLWKEPHELKIAEYLKKGTQVCVTGQPEARGYISNKDTSKVIGSLMVRVSELILLGEAKPQSEANTPAPSAVEPNVYVAQEDDLPF